MSIEFLSSVPETDPGSEGGIGFDYQWQMAGTETGNGIVVRLRMAVTRTCRALFCRSSASGGCRYRRGLFRRMAVQTRTEAGCRKDHDDEGQGSDFF